MSLYHLFPWESMAIFPWELCNNCLTHKCLHAVCSVVLFQAKLVTKAIPLKQECSAPQRLEDKTLFPWTSHTSHCLSRNPQGRWTINSQLPSFLDPQWKAARWPTHTVVSTKETADSYCIVSMAGSRLSKTCWLLIESFPSKAETSICRTYCVLKSFGAIIIRGV